MNDPVLEALNRAAEEVTPQDIESVIAYLRKHRAAYQNGAKIKKEKEIVDLQSLGLEIKPKVTLTGRRF